MTYSGRLPRKVLKHPAYSPHVVPSDYYLFDSHRGVLRSRRFSSDKAVMKTVHKWLKDQPKIFFSDKIHKLVDRWNKCIKKNGECRKMTYFLYSYACANKAKKQKFG